MKFINPFTINNKELYDLLEEIKQEYVPMISQMYDDICNNLSCYKPVLSILPFGCTLRTPTGELYEVTPGVYNPPSYINIYLYDIYIAAYDDCKHMNRTDIDTVFKAEVAYTIVHELSHAMQNTWVDSRLYAAMDYANDQHVQNVLLPILIPMLKKKYKVNPLTDRVDQTVGTVFSYPYNAYTNFDVVLKILSIFCSPNEEEDQRFFDIVVPAKNISVDWRYEPKNSIGKRILVGLRSNGINDETGAIALREFLADVPLDITRHQCKIEFMDSEKTQVLICLTSKTDEYYPFQKN